MASISKAEALLRWPKQDNAKAFYGSPGFGLIKLKLPFRMFLAWDRHAEIYSFAINEKCHDSAARAFEAIAAAFPTDEHRSALGINVFSGCFANRPMRGGSQPSMHSFGCAIDFDDDRNQMKWGKAKSRLAQADCLPFWEAWEAEGWTSLGRTRDFDWMHVQAARL